MSRKGFAPIVSFLILFLVVAALGVSLYVAQNGANLSSQAGSKEPKTPAEKALVSKQTGSCLNLPKTDNFSKLDTDLWDIRVGPNSGINWGSKGASLFVTGAQAGNHDWPQLYAKKPLCGDFDVSLDFSSFKYLINKNSTHIGFGVDNQKGSGVCIERVETVAPTGQKQNRLGYFQSCEEIGGSWQGTSQKATSVDHWKLRIARQGSTVATYYDEGSGWVQKDSFTDQTFTDNMFIGIQLQSRDPDHPDTSAVVNNFVAGLARSSSGTERPGSSSIFPLTK